MAKASTPTLEIKDWIKGIGESPHTGFGQMTNVDIFSSPGVVKISNKFVNDPGSVGIVNEFIKWTAQDPRTGFTYHVGGGGTAYVRDTNGVWSLITGNAVLGAEGQGLGIWKDYLLYARATELDAWGPLSDLGTATWTYNVATLQPSDYHPILASQNDKVYIGNASFMDSMEQKLTFIFDPSDTNTFNYFSEDLIISTEYRIRGLEEIGTDIAIGTDVAGGIVNIADILFWDGVSESISLGKTIHLADNGVQMMKNMGNTLMSIAGLGKPRLFASITSQAFEQRRFNNVNTNSSGTNLPLQLFPDAMDQLDGELLMGIGAATGVVNANPLGIYSYKDKNYVLRYLPSTLSDGSENTLVFGTVKVINPTTIFISWLDQANTPSYGVDVLSNKFYTAYTAYIESPLYIVGTDADPTTFEQVEVRLAKKLVAGDGFKLYARETLEDPWILITTIDTVTNPEYIGLRTIEKTVGQISELVTVQIRIEMTTAENSTSSPELREVVLK